MEHDFNRPYQDVDSMNAFLAIQKHIAAKFGQTIKAMELSNREYQQRYDRMAKSNNMRPPPGSSFHIMSGFLVVRRLGSPDQYETWMPNIVFEELYKADG